MLSLNVGKETRRSQTLLRATILVEVALCYKANHLGCETRGRNAFYVEVCWSTILPDRVKVQHYVPRLLLRWHATEPGSRRRGSEQVWCFDKHTDRVFSPNIRGVTAESGYYEINTEDCTFSLESALSKLEGEAAPLVGRLIETRNLQSLRSADRTTMRSSSPALRPCAR